MKKTKIVKIPKSQADKMLKDLPLHLRLRLKSRWKQDGYIIKSKESFFNGGKI
jgi:hypothetical protein